MKSLRRKKNTPRHRDADSGNRTRETTEPADSLSVESLTDHGDRSGDSQSVESIIDSDREAGRGEMAGFRPGPGNTGSMDGRDETGRKQIGHKV